MGLIAAQLLPAAVLTPAGHSVEHWEQLFKECQPSDWTKPCVLSDDEYHRFLEQLAVAIGRDRAGLATDCDNTMALVREALAEAKRRAILASQTVSKV